ncbi:neuroblast differentiation-associated protein AHNAK isoform X3 [Hippocampus zosterae]|uniref:neuroblast differentiation-associated protein AHNAK isoform X3 n=1 Tax=Hippocampus zosterae TaxID=109293 RepID=UPI00223DFD7C|nr:neuroblast differentiation-associated protein AHNAK isoform X3 [Hippocampus zosterae]
MAAMFSRRRLSDALTLERSERGALVIANIDDVDGANQKLREGDEVVGATIKFDQLSKEEVMGVLKLMEPYDDRIQVLTRNNMSKSMGNLDQLAVSPEMMLRDSYSKLYNTKIKRFMRKDSPDGQNPRDFVQTLPHAARRKTKRDSDLPRLGVDFGRLSPTALVRRFSADSETGRAAYASGAFAQGANLNLPPLGVGQVNAGRRIQVQQRLNDGGRAQAGLVSGIYDDGDDVDAAMALRGTDGRFQAYRLSNGDAKFDVDGYDISQTMHLAGPSSRLNAPGFDLDGRSARSGLRGSTLDVDGPSGDFDVKAPGVIGDFTEPNLHLQGVTAPIPAVRSKVPPGKYKAPKFSMPNFGLPTVEVPRFDGDLPGMDISSPDVRLSKPNIRGLNTTDWSLKSPKIEGAFSGPDLDLKGAGLEMDAPKMPKFSRPNLKGPELDGRLDGLDMDIDAPKFKLGGPGADFGMPDYDLDGPNLDLRSPDLGISGPDLRGGVSASDLEMPRLSLKGPKLDLKSPNLDMPSGKLNMPDLNGPDLNLKAPKLKGGIHGPDVDLPKADLTTPKLDMKTPDINIGSPKTKFKFPKLKMPKFKRPSLRGPDLDADVDGLDMDANVPTLKLKGPKADLGMPKVDIDGKFKKPNLNMPDFDLDGPDLDLKTPNLDFSGPKLHGGMNAPDLKMPTLDLKTPTLDVKSPNLDLPDLQGPDLNLKAPKIKGGLNGPDWDLPNVDLKGGKFDLKTPDINMGSPKAKLKKPKLKMPKFKRPSLKGPDLDADIDGLDMNANAPTLKLKGPNADLGMPNVDIDGKFKKPNLNMPDLDLDGPKVGGLNLDLNSPNLDLSGPNLRGGINGPDMKMPKFDFKSPKLDLKGPNLDLPDLDGPDLNLKAPKIKGGFDGPDLDLPNADLKAPKLDVKTPDINIGSPKTKFKFRKLRIPKLRRPSLKGPDLDVDLDAPDLDINAPTVNLKGSKPNLDLDIGGKFKKPNVNMPNLDVKSPKLDLKAPKMDLSAPDLDVKTPDLQLKAPKLKGGLDVNSPDINMGSPKAKMKMPRIKLPKVNLPTLNGPDIDGPDFDIGAPDVDFGRPSGKYRKPHLKVPDVELSGPNVKSPKYHGKLKGPNAEVNVRAPKVKGSWDTPKAGVPNMDLKAPTTDWNTSDIKYRKPQMKVSAGYDTGLDGRAEGPDLRFPDVRGPNFKPTMSYLDTIDLDGADVSVSGPNAKLRTPDLEVDGSMLKFRKSLHGGSGVPLPGLDLDQDLTHSRFEGMSRASLDADLGHYVDFTRSDLNIDDFTGKYHIPRGRGSDLDLQLPSTSRDVTGQLRGPRLSGTPLNADAILYPSHAEKAAHTLNDGRWSYSQKRAPDTSDGYLVTVFPTQGESENEPKQKHGTLGGLNFVSGDVNLEVPDQDELKGSTYLFSNLV